jgi:hypothetical protein
MYLGISVENFITIGLMLLVWMLALHVAAQVGLAIPKWLPGQGG